MHVSISISKETALGFFAVGHIAVRQFAVRKKKPNLTNLA